MNPQTRPVGYFMGKSLGSCQRCGQTKFTNQLRLEWSGLRVCSPCWDPRPPQLSPPNIYPEGLPVPDASPFPGVSFIDPVLDPVTEADL